MSVAQDIPHQRPRKLTKKLIDKSVNFPFLIIASQEIGEDREIRKYSEAISSDDLAKWLSLRKKKLRVFKKMNLGIW